MIDGHDLVVVSLFTQRLRGAGVNENSNLRVSLLTFRNGRDVNRIDKVQGIKLSVLSVVMCSVSFRYYHTVLLPTPS
ncbi:hypothetical protein L596_020871 [Steinernema carpocapsae]|uniref:Uncharacterized protein n=1 Tax=Steinernema carpocapsae TaxID=34508 RepID=A0A4U5MVJ9_STECR|nr:hypothetical protein L596_020871 [Steinernema carpocapsae]